MVPHRQVSLDLIFEKFGPQEWRHYSPLSLLNFPLDTYHLHTLNLRLNLNFKSCPASMKVLTMVVLIYSPDYLALFHLDFMFYLLWWCLHVGFQFLSFQVILLDQQHYLTDFKCSTSLFLPLQLQWTSQLRLVRPHTIHTPHEFGHSQGIPPYNYLKICPCWLWKDFHHTNFQNFLLCNYALHHLRIHGLQSLIYYHYRPVSEQREPLYCRYQLQTCPQ